MICTDYNKIKRVTFKVPDMMTDKAEEKVIEKFNAINALKDKIADLRMEASKLEQEQRKLEKEWNDIYPLLDIEFETYEKEEIHENVYVGFNFGTDINKHLH